MSFSKEQKASFEKWLLNLFKSFIISMKTCQTEMSYESREDYSKLGSIA